MLHLRLLVNPLFIYKRCYLLERQKRWLCQERAKKNSKRANFLWACFLSLLRCLFLAVEVVFAFSPFWIAASCATVGVFLWVDMYVWLYSKRRNGGTSANLIRISEDLFAPWNWIDKCNYLARSSLKYKFTETLCCLDEDVCLGICCSKKGLVIGTVSFLVGAVRPSCFRTCRTIDVLSRQEGNISRSLLIKNAHAQVL